MVLAGYDKKELYTNQLLLALPFSEGAGSVLYDCAKPHHPVSSNISWASIASGLPVASLNGINQYGDCPAADCADLDITTEDYSIVGWEYHTFSAQSQMVIAHYALDLDGWELYFFDTPPNYYLQLRHHHASQATARSGAYSNGWVNGVWSLIGLSRSGRYPLMYRNGMPLEMGYSAGGMDDPDTCNRDLVIGTRFTKDADWYTGYLKWLRVIVGEALSMEDHRFIFETERHWFGA